MVARLPLARFVTFEGSSMGKARVSSSKVVAMDESDIDLISFKHEAKTRQGFAMGAVLAAEFLHDKKGFYTMSHMLGL